MAAVPVILQFSKVVSNYNLCITLSTPGAAWSIGDGGDGYVGISYNSLSLDEKRTSSIYRIEYTGSTLVICTGPASASDFTLTAFIDVPDGVEWLEGRCLLNEKATVLARLGDLAPVEWREEINCAIPVLLPDIHRATFSIRGIQQGQAIRILLAGNEEAHGTARWRIAPLDNPEIGFSVRSSRDDVALPITALRLDSQAINLTIGNAKNMQASGADLIVEAYIERIRLCRYCPPLENVQMKMECDGSVSATVRVGNHRPQYLEMAYKLFYL